MRRGEQAAPPLPNEEADWNIWDRQAQKPGFSTMAEQVARGLMKAEGRFAQWEGKDWLPGEAGQSVLDVGCGNGNYAPFFWRGKGMHYTGCDLSTAMLELARRDNPGVEFVRADATDLPFEDRSFDMTFCSDLLIHLPPELESEVIGELRRVARVYAVLHQRVMIEAPRFEEQLPNGIIHRYEVLDEELMAMRGVDCEVEMRMRNARNVAKRPGADVFFIFRRPEGEGQEADGEWAH
ncbi:MAG TPA: class I SAM-dependent methyltransferase [Armatimonadota bacterium]|nr:class I SAM-dependent methyltransferase [Armatimonadota bacterium]